MSRLPFSSRCRLRGLLLCLTRAEKRVVAASLPFAISDVAGQAAAHLDGGRRQGQSQYRDNMHDWVLANENMAKVLAAKGYHYQFIFARNAGHTDRTVKQQTLPEALEYLRRGYPDRRADELIFVGRVPDVPDLPDRQHMFNGVPRQ